MGSRRFVVFLSTVLIAGICFWILVDDDESSAPLKNKSPEVVNEKVGGRDTNARRLKSASPTPLPEDHTTGSESLRRAVQVLDAEGREVPEIVVGLAEVGHRGQPTRIWGRYRTNNHGRVLIRRDHPLTQRPLVVFPVIHSKTITTEKWEGGDITLQLPPLAFLRVEIDDRVGCHKDSVAILDFDRADDPWMGYADDVVEAPILDRVATFRLIDPEVPFHCFARIFEFGGPRLERDLPLGLQTTGPTTLRLIAPDGGISGRVLTDKGEPLANREVSIRVESLHTRQGPPPKPGYTMTRADGHFLCFPRHEGGESLVTLMRPLNSETDFRREGVLRHLKLPAAGIPIDMGTVILQHEQILARGRVRDEFGRRYEGANVGLSMRMEGFLWQGLSTEAEVFPDMFDADYVLKGLFIPGAEYRLWCQIEGRSASGRAAVPHSPLINLPNANHDFVAPRGRRIEGHVKGLPQSEWNHVLIMGTPSIADTLRKVSPSVQSKIDPKGRFMVDGLFAENYDVELRWNGNIVKKLSRVRPWAPGEDGDRRLRPFQATGLRTIKLKIVDEEGQPFRQHFMSLVTDTGHHVRNKRTNIDGQLSFLVSSDSKRAVLSVAPFKEKNPRWSWREIDLTTPPSDVVFADPVPCHFTAICPDYSGDARDEITVRIKGSYHRDFRALWRQPEQGVTVRINGNRASCRLPFSGKVTLRSSRFVLENRKRRIVLVAGSREVHVNPDGSSHFEVQFKESETPENQRRHGK